jgi:hypothetical protein
MKVLWSLVAFIYLCSCSCARVEKVVESPQVQQDAEKLVGDSVEAGVSNG